MRKLELKELAAYLPYGVEYFFNGNNYVLKTIDHLFESNDFGNSFGGKKIKLILRPLSQLTEEITHNGETFVPVEWLEEKYYTLSLHKECERLLEEDGHNWINHMSHLLVIHLLEWHFDCFSLLDDNLAIEKPAK